MTLPPSEPGQACCPSAGATPRPLLLRLLGLLGALSFLMLGVSSVVLPLLESPQPPPVPAPDRASSTG